MRIYETRYYGPTDHRGSRIKATWLERRIVDEPYTRADGTEMSYWREVWAEKPVWMDGWDYSRDTAQNHHITIRRAWPNAGTIRYGGQTEKGMLWIVEEEEL